MKKLTVGIVLFEGFEPLDVFGPAEMFGISECFEMTYLAMNTGDINGRFNVTVAVDNTLARIQTIDVLFVPGGMGTRSEVANSALIEQLMRLSKKAPYILSVCTGAALLAKTGCFDGRQMTTNKRAFEWVVAQRPQVIWQRNARWVEDGNLFSSSGVSAGTDMALGFIARLFGNAKAEEAAKHAEYLWNSNKADDPFAVTI